MTAPTYNELLKQLQEYSDSKHNAIQEGIRLEIEIASKRAEVSDLERQAHLIDQRKAELDYNTNIIIDRINQHSEITQAAAKHPATGGIN